MTLQSVIELILALGAVLLLARDLHRAWLDQLRRPITLLMAALMAALLIGAIGGSHPSPWWLALPATILAWEAGRGWRRAPRCHSWEAAIGAFAASLLLAGVGLGLAGSTQTLLLPAAAGAALVGAALLRRSYRQEPRPWRVGDAGHYERRSAQRSSV